MSAALLALLLAAPWMDPTGRVRCDVPDRFSSLPNQPWRYERDDGLRQLVFLTVRPVAIGPAQRSAELLQRAGASPLGELPVGLKAAFAIAPTEPTWSGVLVLGPPAADVQAEADALAATCRKATPSVTNGRVYDVTRRSSAQIPFGLDALDLRNAGAVQGEGFTIRVTAVQKKGAASLQELSIEWLQPSGAKLDGTAGASAGPATAPLPTVIATGTLVQSGVEYVIEVAAIDLGNGEVGGLSLSSTRPALLRARSTLDAMLRTLSVTAE